MGTSRNDRSPDTPNWKPVLAALGNPLVDAERQNLEIWRAAFAQEGVSLERDLGSSLLAAACSYISRGLPLNRALSQFDQVARRNREASFVIDLARRAFIRSSARKESASSFVGETFAELVSYYASRDLSSFIGAKHRLANVAESVELKEQLQSITKHRVAVVGEPATDPRGWRKYIRRVSAALCQPGTRS
jgi:preprotein translocase subunit SecA